MAVHDWTRVDSGLFHVFHQQWISSLCVALNGGVLPPDPQEIHKAIWDEFQEEEFEPPRDMPLTLAAYDAGPPRVAYVESLAVGDTLPLMPLFLKPEIYVPAPLEATYQTTWGVFPTALKGLLECA